MDSTLKLNKTEGKILKVGLGAAGVAACFTPFGAIAGVSGLAGVGVDLVGGAVADKVINKASAEVSKHTENAPKKAKVHSAERIPKTTATTDEPTKKAPAERHFNSNGRSLAQTNSLLAQGITQLLEQTPSTFSGLLHPQGQAQASSVQQAGLEL